MKQLILLLFLTVSTSLFSEVSMTTVRDLFARSATDEATCSKLIAMTKKYTLTTYGVLYAYHSAAEMAMANHAFWPATKLSHFNSGKWKLEAAVKKYPKDVEIRYIRYCVQQGCPFFLDYASSLETDRKFVLDNIDQTDWTDAYKKKVREFLKAT